MKFHLTDHRATLYFDPNFIFDTNTHQEGHLRVEKPLSFITRLSAKLSFVCMRKKNNIILYEWFCTKVTLKRGLGYLRNGQFPLEN